MIDKLTLVRLSNLLRSRRLPHLCIVLILLFGSFLNLSAQTPIPAPVAGRDLPGQPAAQDGAGWRIEVVDSQGMVGFDSSLALDGSGRPHISYFDVSNADLKHAWRDGMGWQTETVDSEGAVGQMTSLALDAAGYPHISYADYGNEWVDADLKYAWQDASGWYSETVDTGGAGRDVGHFTSLALDGDGYAHISYCDMTNGDLKHAWQNGTGWHVEVVDSQGVVGLYSSLALDAGGYPHISYYGADGSDLKVAWQNGTGWHVEIVDSGDVGGGTSLALDGSGYSHVGYYDSSTGDLRYAYQDVGGWHLETADSEGYVALGPSLALDGSGYPHISYYDVANGALKVATQDATGWRTEIVESAGVVAVGSSLALDGGDHPHISYFGVDGGDLKYAAGDQPDLSESVKRVSPPHPAPGDRVTYTLALANSGAVSTAFTVTDPILLHTAYVPGSAWANGGVITAADGITWTGVISPSLHLTATFAVTVDAAITLPTAIINSATLSGDPAGPRMLVAGFIIDPITVYLPRVGGEDWGY